MSRPDQRTEAARRAEATFEAAGALLDKYGFRPLPPQAQQPQPPVAELHGWQIEDAMELRR